MFSFSLQPGLGLRSAAIQAAWSSEAAKGMLERFVAHRTIVAAPTPVSTVAFGKFQAAWSLEAAETLLERFTAAMGPSILFLQHLRRLRLMAWPADAQQPICTAQVGYFQLKSKLSIRASFCEPLSMSRLCSQRLSKRSAAHQSRDLKKKAAIHFRTL